MLAGLQAAASALNVGSVISNITANNIANINTPNFKSKFATIADQYNPGVQITSIQESYNAPMLYPTGSFRQDVYGGVTSPQGDYLFNTANGVSVDENGFIKENNRLLGKVDIFDNNMQTSENFIALSNVDIAREMTDNLVNLRFFQANIKMVNASDEMLGTVINMRA